MLDWKPILDRWSRELMATDLAGSVDPPPESADWLGFDPATPSDIAVLEKRLGLILPPSYTAFLQTTNGWRSTNEFIHRIRPTAEVDWLRVENEQWVDAYQQYGSELDDEEYYRYTKDGASDHRVDHLESLLQISDVGDGVYLLNPRAVTRNGEWEAWYFANWVPGAERFPSFAHLLLHDYATFRKRMKIKGPLKSVASSNQGSTRCLMKTR